MKIFIICLLNFFLFSQDQDEIYNRIITDKFFRGVVADNIIENKKYTDVVQGDFYTYSELRAGVMSWIAQNPKEATKRFSDILSKTGKYKVKYQLYDYKINPKLRDLIDKMESAAKNGISDEKKRDYASFLFEGFKENSSLGVEMGMNVGAEYEKPVSYNYVTLNLNNLSKEIERIDRAYNYLKDFNVEDIAGIIKASDIKYREFSKYVLSLKGSKRINYEQGEKIKEILKDVSRLISIRYLVVKYRGVESDVTTSDLKSLLERIKSDIISLYLGSYSFFNDSFFNLYSIIDDISKEISFMKKIKSIIEAISHDEYSCFLDYIVKNLSYSFWISSKYRDIKNKKKEMEKYFCDIYKELEMRDSKSEIFEDVDKKIIEAMFLINIEKDISLKHRKIQFLFFDNIIFWDIYYHRGERYFGLKTDIFGKGK